MTHLQAVIDQLEAERFVGRTAELDLFRRLLQSGEAGLLNVHGVGGIGKTSLLRAFAREAAAFGATWVSIDGAGLQPTPREFCRQLCAELEAHFGSGPTPAADESVARASVAACHAALSQLAAAGQQLVLAIDTYEDIKPLDRWLRQTFLVGLPGSTVIVIAGRTPLGGEWLHSPAWRALIHPLPLAEFSLPQVHEYLGRYGVSDKRAIHGLWLGTHGHPLALTLAAPLASTDFALQGPSAQTDAVLDELIRLWLKEVASEPLRLLVEAAATLPDWDQDTLSEVTGQDVPMADFEQLIMLSFVRRTRRGWSLHNLVRDAAAANVRAVSPERYRRYRQQALRHVHRRLLAAPAHDADERTRLLSQAFYLIGSPLMRQVFAHDPADSGYFLEPATAEEIALWSTEPPPWRSTTYLARLLQPLAEPAAEPAMSPVHEHGRDIRQASPTYLEELLTLDPGCIHVLRDADGGDHGILVTIPISGETMSFLQSQPVTRPYFSSLSPDELSEYAPADGSTSGWFIRAIGLSNPEDSTALAALLYHTIPLLFTDGRVLTSTPLPFYHRILHGLGFQEVPGASHYDFGPDVASPTFLLDLRGIHLAAHIERLALHAGFEPLQRPSPLAELGLTAREQEVAELVAEGLSNREVAERLHLSEITVKKHLSQVLAKAGLKSRGQLIRLTHQHEAGSRTYDRP